MRVAILQATYPTDATKATKESVAESILKEIEAFEEPCDLFALPEYSNFPGDASEQDLKTFSGADSDRFLRRVSDIARNKKSNIAVNILCREDGRLKNATVLLDRSGTEVARYIKAHLSHAESQIDGFASGNNVVVTELEGVKLAFATCFDIYFAEYMEAIAQHKPDILILPSYQRSEKSDVIRKQTIGRALDLEAYVVRASYAMGEDSATGGTSLIISPEGETLLDAHQQSGVFSCDIDPTFKRVRPIAHGLPQSSSREIVETARRPLLYRSFAPVESRKDLSPFPRVIAHRGLSGLCPENTLLAFGAGIGIGADEIEFDITPTKDRELAICHDYTANRTTGIDGEIADLTWEKLSCADAGSWFGEGWVNVPMPRFEDVLESFAGLVVMNMHVKEPGDDGWVIRKMADLVRKHNIREQVYFAGSAAVMEWARRLAPDIDRCCLEGQHDWTIVDHAIRLECDRVQFFVPTLNKDLVDKAHDHGIICNVFYANTVEDAERYYEMGVDVVLSDYANLVMPVRDKFRAK